MSKVVTDFEDEVKKVLSVHENDTKNPNRWVLKNALQDEILVNWIKQGCQNLTAVRLSVFDLYLLKANEYLLADGKTSSMYNMQIHKIDVENCIAVVNTASVIKRINSRQFTTICNKNELQVSVPSEILDREQETETVRQDDIQALNAYLAEHGFKTRIES